jgi:FHS family L-fucose permease-like MFS transporter
MAYKHLVFGVLAMFFYMGAEACTAGFFIPYLKTEMGFDDQKAASYLTLYYILTAVMGMLAVVLLRYVKAHILVGIFSIGMIMLYLVCIGTHTDWNAILLACLGLFLSLMFPTIFSLAIEEVGAFTGKGSALVNFALIGGSIFPPLQGLLADKYGVRFSYVVPLFCFIMIMLYAFFYTREALLKRSGRPS